MTGMKKISSALKWLAEKRARAAGDLAHMEELLTEGMRLGAAS